MTKSRAISCNMPSLYRHRSMRRFLLVSCRCVLRGENILRNSIIANSWRSRPWVPRSCTRRTRAQSRNECIGGGAQSNKTTKMRRNEIGKHENQRQTEFSTSWEGKTCVLSRVKDFDSWERRGEIVGATSALISLGPEQRGILIIIMNFHLFAVQTFERKFISTAAKLNYSVVCCSPPFDLGKKEMPPCCSLVARRIVLTPPELIGLIQKTRNIQRK